MRRAVLCLLLVVATGCLGGSDIGNTDPADGPPDAKWVEGEGINETVLANQHFETLRSEGSFTLNRTSTVAIDGETLSLINKYETTRLRRNKYEAR
jgi:hypothetical protein